MRDRNRFFEVFLRDRLNRTSQANQEIIKSGNHNRNSCGWGSMDALLFEKGIRDDTDTFILLYGVMPRKVVTIISMLILLSPL